MPIYICYDSGLDFFEQAAVNDAARELKRILPDREIINFGSRAWSEGEYSSADWYVRNARRLSFGVNEQLDAHHITNLLMEEPWQKDDPHIDVLVTAKDLSVKGFNFCFGATVGRFTVNSVRRYRSLRYDDRRLVIKSLIWHELGHVLGAAGDQGRVNTECKIGQHCLNRGCVMRQGMNLSEAVRIARDAAAAHQIYCPQCLADIKRSRV